MDGATNHQGITRRTDALATVAALLAVASGGGCGDIVGVPQPQPVPSAIRRSTPALRAPSPRTLLVGLPGAVAGAGEVQIDVQGWSIDASAPTTASGTFAAVVAVGSSATLEIRFARDGELSDPLVLSPTLSQSVPTPRGNKLQLTAPDSSGRTTITNVDSTGSVTFGVPAGDEVLLSNARSGSVARTFADSSGRFTTQLAARSGDDIHLLVVDRRDAAATSDFFTATVP